METCRGKVSNHRLSNDGDSDEPYARPKATGRR